jgi:chromosome segregation ATPase
VGVSARGVSSSWGSEEAIFLKKEKKEVTKKNPKTRVGVANEILAKVTDLDRQVQKLAKDFSQSTARAEELAKEIETSNAKVEALTAEIAEARQIRANDPNSTIDLSALTKEVNFTNEKLDALQNQIATIIASSEQLTVTGRGYQENLAKQESAISEISSRVDTLEREILLKINERIDAIDKNLHSNSSETLYGQSINEKADDTQEIDLVLEIRKLGDRIAVVENHISGHGEKLGTLQNSISEVTRRLDNIEN